MHNQKRISPIISQMCSIRTVGILKSIASSKIVVGKNKIHNSNQTTHSLSHSYVDSEERAIRKNFGKSCFEMKTRVDSLLKEKKEELSGINKIEMGCGDFRQKIERLRHDLLHHTLTLEQK